MSNFVCPYCGMKNIDCGGHGYKTPMEIKCLEALENIKEYAEELGENLGNTSYLRIKILDECEQALNITGRVGNGTNS